MQLTLLGTGLPIPNPHRRGPSSLIRANAHNLLVDCGSGVVHQMVQMNVSPGDVHHLFVTHLHSDHFIDLGHFIVMRWIMGRDVPLNVYGPKGTQFLVERTLEFLEADIRMRMKIRKEPREMPDVRVLEIDAGPAAEIDGLTVTAFDVEHFPLDQPFGYRVETKDRVAVLSGDTCPCENLIRHAHGADVLVHECVEDATWPDPRIDHSLTSRSHTDPTRLGTVAREAAVKLLVTTHMNPDSDPQKLREVIGRDFAGPMVVGEDLMTT